MKNFALIGAAGYIAPRHLQAIAATGNRLVAAIDPHDSVGILDRHFPEARFFTEIERFDRFLERLRRERHEQRIEYVSVCSPNYLHDAHARLGLRVHADVICEKPLTVTPWNLDALQEIEHEYQRRVYTVLQLRLLPALAALKERLERDPNRGKPHINLSYITRRGPWYQTSWKGNEAKSGGVAMNIGVHFFDLLLWMFGRCDRFEVHYRSETRMAGMLELEWATVTWLLSLEKEDLPEGYLEQGKPAFRSFTLDGKEIEFSSGFTELHTEVYRDILAGGGFGIDDARASVELAYRLRTAELTAAPSAEHPATRALQTHGVVPPHTFPPPPPEG